MTSSEIRQSFLDFFREKGHTIVPSSSLLPDAPNLLFTNAGMNQFVPIFLGQTKCPYIPPRAADTQKCIRAGGKHNDLEDVGLDTYHHTFFEMLGNWSFGDYFKREAIDWAWELLVKRWKFPPERLYATYFGGDDKIPADAEARDWWLRYLPAEHVKPFGRKDNFWMMGDTGPCGPCSEIHVDLTPGGDTQGKLVNAGDARCMEIWNLVFIQFNAEPGGAFNSLPTKHVDTGMGFERVAGIIQCTNGLKDFSRPISNYSSDVFTPIFQKLEEISGKQYTGDLKNPADIAFRVIGDHIRCLSFAIADGIQPSNEGRGYVLRRILRRAVRYGRSLGFREPFFFKLVPVVADHFGEVFPEIAERQERITGTLKSEEDSFNRTLDAGIQIFENMVLFKRGVQTAIDQVSPDLPHLRSGAAKELNRSRGGQVGWDSLLGVNTEFLREFGAREEADFVEEAHHLAQDVNVLFPMREPVKDLQKRAIGVERFLQNARLQSQTLSGRFAFKLYDEKGFPLDLTELMARERGLIVDVAGFERLMDGQRQRAREDHAKKKTVVSVVGERGDLKPTTFVGYDALETEAVVMSSGAEIILDRTPFYAEMGGQVGDTGQIGAAAVLDTQKQGSVYVHRCTQVAAGMPPPPEVGQTVRAEVDAARRADIQRHHTVTHLFHWALHEVVNRDARQRGSLVAPDRLRFDFNHPEKLSDQQIADVERLVNDRIKENAPIHWFELPYSEVRGNPNVMQFFGDKYGDTVRVVQIGGRAGALDGFSMELCGGTHTKATGEISLFKITREFAIAAGVRRVEAVSGRFATEFIAKQSDERQAEAQREQEREREKDEERRKKSEGSRRAGEIAEELLGGARPLVSEVPGADAELLRAVVDALKPKLTSGIVVLGGVSEGKVSLICYVTPDLVRQGKHAGKIVGAVAKICGGGGGGRPDLAQAGGKQPEKLAAALAAVPGIVG